MTYQTDEKPKAPSQRYQKHAAARRSKLARGPSSDEHKAHLREIRRQIGEEVYFIEDVTSGWIKIGYACEPRGRLYRLQSGNPGELRLLASFPHATAPEVEAHLHTVFHDHRGRGEWFSPNEELSRLIRVVQKRHTADDMISAVVFIRRGRRVDWAVKAAGLTMEEWRAAGDSFLDEGAGAE